MKRITSIIAGVGTLVIGITFSAWAQDASTTPTTPTQGPAFVDDDGDGICDFTSRMHQAQGRMGTGGRGAGLGAITLTPEQQAQVDNLKLDHQKAVVLAQALLQTKQLELNDLLRAAQPDQSAINAKIDEINTVQSQLQKEAAAYQVAVRGVLTPEQQAVLDARGTGANAGMGNGRGVRGAGRGMGRGRGGMMGQGQHGAGTSNPSSNTSQTKSGSSK